MKAYYINMQCLLSGDDWDEFYSSIKKAKKAKAKHKKNKNLFVDPTIYNLTWEPTKKGFIRCLNRRISGVIVEDE